MYDGWYNVVKILWSLLYIGAFAVIFELEEDRRVDVYPLVFIVVMVLYIIP